MLSLLYLWVVSFNISKEANQLNSHSILLVLMDGVILSVGYLALKLALKITEGISLAMALQV